MTIDHPQVRHVILTLLKAAVPERSSEIDALWQRFNPAVEVAPDSSGIAMDATRHRIRFDGKTMRVLWLMGFNGWQSTVLYSPAIVLSGPLGLSIDALLNEDDERGLLESDFRSRTRTAENLKDAKNSDDIPWPEDIPAPGEDREQLGSDQEKATFDLVCMATAFVLLHEFRHVMFHAEGTRPEQRLEEEIACDVWARSFMTEKVGDYARATGQSHRAILQKRAMALALGAVILHDMTPEFERWGSKDYPPIADRIHSMISGIGPSEDSSYWLFAACLLTGVYRRAGRHLPMVVTDHKALVVDLVEQLR